MFISIPRTSLEAALQRLADSAKHTKSSRKAGAEVIGISGDSLQSHEAFVRQYKLPFILLSDSDGSARQAYQVKKSLGFIPGRVSFVIDKQGIIRHIFSSQVRATAHVDEALAVLKSLS